MFLEALNFPDMSVDVPPLVTRYLKHDLKEISQCKFMKTINLSRPSNTFHKNISFKKISAKKFILLAKNEN